MLAPPRYIPGIHIADIQAVLFTGQGAQTTISSNVYKCGSFGVGACVQA